MVLFVLPARLKCVCFPFFFLVTLLPDSLAQHDTLRPPAYIIDSIVLNGNKITKASIILRELDLKAGDSLSGLELEEKTERSKRNLLNTSLFIFVETCTAVNNTARSGSNTIHLSVHFNFRERWYLWPVPIFELYEQNFNTWYLHPTLNKLDYGLYLNQYNFLGRKQTLSFTIRAGYVEQYGITYTVPYLDKQKKSGLVAGLVYSRAREIPYTNQDNLFLFYRDDTHPVRQERMARLTYTYRGRIYNTLFAEARYTLATVQDTLLRLNSNYFNTHSTAMQFMALSTGFVRDLRDSKPYPLNGYYINASVNCYLLSAFQQEHTEVWALNLILRRYMHLGGRFYAGSAFKGRYTGKQDVPFYLESTLGYRDYVRGYEYYVMEGQSFGLLKNVIRYQFVKPHVQKIPYLTWEKFNTFHYAFYADLFADLGYIQNRYDTSVMGNTLDNAWLYGYGAGIDFVTYYDFVLRAEWAYNKMGAYGFFLHLNSPL